MKDMEYFSSLDLSKFNRLFTIGCSFTSYRYPTWANVMHHAMPEAEFYNLGIGGAGNQFISNRLTEAHRKFNFCETDLVMVMWSTHCREDRWVPGGWITPGNIYTQGEYDEKFVSKYCHPLGYLIRDLALIDLSNAYLSTLSCTHVSMLSVAFEFQQVANDYFASKKVLETYKNVVDYFPPSMLELEMNGRWTTDVVYEIKGKKMPDYHPTPLNYYNYLKKIGIPLNEDALQFATQADATLKSITSMDEIRSEWPNLDKPLGQQEGFW